MFSLFKDLLNNWNPRRAKLRVLPGRESQLGLWSSALLTHRLPSGGSSLWRKFQGRHAEWLKYVVAGQMRGREGDRDEWGWCKEQRWRCRGGRGVKGNDGRLGKKWREIKRQKCGNVAREISWDMESDRWGEKGRKEGDVLKRREDVMWVNEYEGEIVASDGDGCKETGR